MLIVYIYMLNISKSGILIHFIKIIFHFEKYYFTFYKKYICNYYLFYLNEIISEFKSYAYGFYYTQTLCVKVKAIR